MSGSTHSFKKNILLRIFICMLVMPLISYGDSELLAQSVADPALRMKKRQYRTIAIPLSDSLKLEQQQKHRDATATFYSKVKTTAHKNFFSRQVYPLLFKNQPAQAPSGSVSGSEPIPFLNEKGKIIRSVRIYKSEVFGSSVFDTTLRSDLWLDRTLNSLHFNTHDQVIRSYLQFHKGDRINPVVLADNERILRQSALFEDARLMVISNVNSDSADIVVIIRDVFPVGFDLKVRDAHSSSVRLYNRNIFGFGQQLSQSFEINTDQRPRIYLSEGALKIRNIRRSFTDVVLAWQNRPDIKTGGIQVTKPFISPETRTGGGLFIRNTKSMTIPGDQQAATTLEYSEYDLWGGYSTIINRFQSPAFDRSVIAIAGRYYNLNMKGSPSVVMRSLYPSVTVNRYLAAVSLIRSGYYRSNMVTGFGRTEDIPTGHMARLTLGYETSILHSRVYSGIKLLSGRLLTRNGFIYSWFEGSGYWSEGRMNDGVAGLGCDYISPLYKSGTFRIRSFGSLSYLKGINRTSDSRLLLKNNDFTETFNRFETSGDQRITARIESVIFSPYYLLGFRFAAYAFAEAAAVAPNSQFVLKGDLVPAVGFGLRIKNENLAFSTFQIGLTWYGKSDHSGRNMIFEFSDIPQINLMRFNIEAPEITGYR
ncbi:MAG: Uncharacterized protein FD166_2603 [Bacteroidetes bacterium]|nr:MAG: Uncharacterized protein FD166_2603 [Bacteroidota bacterium]